MKPRAKGPIEAESFRFVPRSVLVILRVHLGVILLITDAGKMLRGNAPFSVEMLSFLQGFVMRNASMPYQHFLQQIVIPHDRRQVRTAGHCGLHLHAVKELL